MKITPEICIDSYESSLNVNQTVAKRVELCSSLDVGGLTPSVGLVKLIKKNTDLIIFSLIRPRSGNFIYNKEEKATILSEIKSLISAGVDGLVVGALTPQFTIDIEFMKDIKSVAKNIPLVFHRAFDQLIDPYEGVRQLIKLGFIRILTSGQKANAFEGKELLKDLISKFGEQITIMPGGGVRVENVLELIEYTKCKEIHFSAKTSYLNAPKISGKVNFNTYSTPENKISISQIKDINAMIKQIKKARQF